MRGQVEGFLEFRFFGRRDWIFWKEEFGVRGKFVEIHAFVISEEKL